MGGVLNLGRVNKSDIRAALILGSVAAAAGLARWHMDGSQAEAARLLSALQHPFERLQSLGGLVVGGGVIAFSYFVWWLLLGRRRPTRMSAQAPQDGEDTTPA